MSTIDLIIQPDEDEAEAALVLVDGAIDGQPYRFLLDTGAARTTVGLNDHTVTFPALPQGHTSSGVFASGVSDLVTVPVLQVGPIVRHNLTIARMSDADPSKPHIIGMDVLRDHRCTFLFDQQRLVLDEAGPADEEGTPHALILDSKAHPYVQTRCDDEDANAIWDTGASITVVDTGFIERHPEHFRQAGSSTGTDSTGARMHTPMFIMEGLIVGSQVLPAHRAAGVPLSHLIANAEIPAVMILGYSALRHANWSMDFPRQQWRMWPIAAPPLP